MLRRYYLVLRMTFGSVKDVQMMERVGAGSIVAVRSPKNSRLEKERREWMDPSLGAYIDGFAWLVWRRARNEYLVEEGGRPDNGVEGGRKIMINGGDYGCGDSAG